MAEQVRDLVVLVTHGVDHELSSVAFTIANGGMTADSAHVPPLDPLADLVKDFLARGGNLWACMPCVKSRGHGPEDLIQGTVITGASKVHELLKQGAATLCF